MYHNNYHIDRLLIKKNNLRQATNNVYFVRALAHYLLKAANKKKHLDDSLNESCLFYLAISLSLLSFS